MSRFFRWSWVCLLPVLLLGGCASGSIYNTAITNLTPARLTRNAENLYLVEAHWRSNQQSIRKDSFKAYVKVGTEFYPMRPSPLLANRWETLLPVPAGQNVVHYQFKFDYLVNAVPEIKPDSKLSAPQVLEIVNP
jgi:hypothetical protein